MRSAPRVGGYVLKTFIDALDWDRAVDQVRLWANRRESRYICICNAHSVVTASGDQEFQRILSDADMATPDGAPVAWVLRRTGFPDQERINGPDLMLRYCAVAEKTGESLYLYGASPETLKALVESLYVRFPALKIAGTHSPPFRELTEDENTRIVEDINGSGASTVWVGLGCPKQERWMSANRGRVAAVMIGVGAAFDYHAGNIRRAPLWFQNHGLEWLFRLLMEPRRLWKRYLVTNSLFAAKALTQLATRSSKR